MADTTAEQTIKVQLQNVRKSVISPCCSRLMERMGMKTLNTLTHTRTYARHTHTHTHARTDLSYPSHTCQSFHPRPLVYSQVVVDDLQDVAQQAVHVLGGQGGTAAVSRLRVALRPVLPPVRHVAAQHRQHHLNRTTTPIDHASSPNVQTVTLTLI